MKNEQHFNDKHVFFKWTIEDPLEGFYQSISSYIQLMIQAPLTIGNSSFVPLLPYSAIQVAIKQFDFRRDSSLMGIYSPATCIDSLPNIEDWQNALFLLSNLGPDSLLRVILSKS